jgi:XTP/dITP diphosphohydrolase
VRILIASGNAKKRRELEELLAPAGIGVVGPEEVGGLAEVLEDQPTFLGNARKKAAAAARATGLWALADDSGLEVDCLDGAPGVHSARFAGEHGNDAANNHHLLEELEGVAEENRKARFVCALVLARPDGSLAVELMGEARGRILTARRGGGDFGYDPLFLFTEEGFDQTGRSFAELSGPQKSAVSHRGRALRMLLSRLGEEAAIGR